LAIISAMVRRSSSVTPGSAAGGARSMDVSDVAADLEAEGVAIEGQGGVRVIVREEAGVNGDVHGDQASCGSETRASRFLTGRKPSTYRNQRYTE
jgi:hypothetical protein